jgi:siroheme synthase (precorrin-2 oxidase/ferrochelatase)
VRLRKQLEACFGPEYGPWVDYLGRRRAELLGALMPVAQRRRLLRRLASRQAFQQFLRKTSKKAPQFKR